MKTKGWYGYVSPRGFWNEIAVYRFSSRKMRDLWLDRYARDGGTTSAKACSARQAKEILSRCKDPLTENYISGPIDGDEILSILGAKI